MSAFLSWGRARTPVSAPARCRFGRVFIGSLVARSLAVSQCGGYGSDGESCGGVRAGEPHDRQLLPLDAGVGRERGHRLAGPAQPAGARPGRTPGPRTRKWLHAQQAGTATPATHTQFDTAAVLPFYAYLAATGAFLENHCSGFGTNSTPNHLLIVGGQTPTLRNPPRTAPQPVWDMPSLPGHAGDHGLTWKAYTGTLRPTRSRSTGSWRARRTSSAATRSSPTPPTLPAAVDGLARQPLRRAPRRRRHLGPGQDLAGRGRDRAPRATGTTPCSC